MIGGTTPNPGLINIRATSNPYFPKWPTTSCLRTMFANCTQIHQNTSHVMQLSFTANEDCPRCAWPRLFLPPQRLLSLLTLGLYETWSTLWAINILEWKFPQISPKPFAISWHAAPTYSWFWSTYGQRSQEGKPPGCVELEPLSSISPL